MPAACRSRSRGVGYASECAFPRRGVATVGVPRSSLVTGILSPSQAIVPARGCPVADLREHQGLAGVKAGGPVSAERPKLVEVQVASPQASYCPRARRRRVPHAPQDGRPRRITAAERCPVIAAAWHTAAPGGLASRISWSGPVVGPGGWWLSSKTNSRSPSACASPPSPSPAPMPATPAEPWPLRLGASVDRVAERYSAVRRWPPPSRGTDSDLLPPRSRTVSGKRLPGMRGAEYLWGCIRAERNQLWPKRLSPIPPPLAHSRSESPGAPR